jgi:protein-disulfide isomerase
MPSGKKSRQQRRDAGTLAVKSPPPVRSKGTGARPRQASPRALAIGGGVVALIAVAVVLALVLGRGGSSTGIPSGTPTVGRIDANSLPGAADANALFKGVPQAGLTLGSASAPVQMVMFIDLQCPVCQNFELTAMPTLVRKYIRTGKVRVELKPWAFIGPDSFKGRLATIAASFQDKAYTFAEVLYLNQGQENTGWLDDSMIAQIAASVPGLDVPKLFADRNSARAKNIAKTVDAQAQVDKVSGTPTILVGKTGTTPKNVTSAGAAPTLDDVTTAIDAALAG